MKNRLTVSLPAPCKLFQPLALLVTLVPSVGAVAETPTICGAPTFNRSIDSGLYLWKTGCSKPVPTYNVRALAGRSVSEVLYEGWIDTRIPPTVITGIALEKKDVLLLDHNGHDVYFELYATSGYLDGFSFPSTGDTQLCFGANQPPGTVVKVGPKSTPMALPFNPETLGPCPIGTAAGDWSRYSFNLNGSRHNSDEDTIDSGNVSDLSLSWKTQIGAVGWSSPALVDGVVYGASWGMPKVYAIDAATGSFLWTTPLDRGTESSVSVTNDTVYVGTASGAVVALDASTGSKKWTALTGKGKAIWSSPQEFNGRVYVGSMDFSIYAFNAIDGSLSWSFPTGDGVRSTAAIVDKTVFFSSWDKHVYALDAESGAKRWSTRTALMGRSSPAIVDGTLYVGADNGQVFALDAATGAIRWKSSAAGGPIWSSPAIADGRVIAGSLDHFLYAFDARTGALLWKKELDYRIHASPTIANGIVYVGTDEGESGNPAARGHFRTYALDAANGNELWSSTECLGTQGFGSDANVVVSNGTVLAENEQGYLCAFKIP